MSVSPPLPPSRGRRGGNADHFRILADYAPVMIWLAGPDRRCAYVNRPWLEFTGRALEVELGFGRLESIHHEDRPSVVAAYERAFDACEPFEAEYRLRRHDGEYRWVFDRGVPLVHDGKLNGFVGSCVDMTDRLLAERAARRAEDFRKLAAHLTMVSHELRSPLNGIKSWTHVLDTHLRDADPAVRRALDGIMTGVEHQARLIEDLLDATRTMRALD
jgi:PAS domain S-box-containing protein